MKSSSLKSPPRKKPKAKATESKSPKRQTLKELQDLQKLAGSLIMQPLAPGFKSKKYFRDGRSNEEIASTFIKANDRLTPFERIGIYNKQYWYRLVDIVYDDYPGLLALLGRLKFNRLICEYLDEHPSESFLLRDLGKMIGPYLEQHPHLVPAKRLKLCQEMALFEWAQVLAFDEPGELPLQVDDLLGKDPATLKLGVQPYITLMHLNWPLDDFAIQLKKSDLRGDASNAVDAPRITDTKTVPMPAQQETYVAVHRMKNDLYYKRMDREGFNILKHLRSGMSLGEAVALEVEASKDPERWIPQIQAWFKNWTEMGWFYLL